MKLYFIASHIQKAQELKKALIALYGQTPEKKADVIVAIGGDGTMLDVLHHSVKRACETPIYGINLGSFGFLLNPYEEGALIEKIDEAISVHIHPLRMHALTHDNKEHEAFAFNEVSLMRETQQTAHLSISINDIVRLPKLICDGVMVATPAGSTAYNFSAQGPILPIGANVLALTPISPFRPRAWRGAVLREKSHFDFTILNPKKRPVSVTADSTEIRNIKSVHVRQSKQIARTLLFDPDHNLEERILNEQFSN